MRRSPAYCLLILAAVAVVPLASGCSKEREPAPGTVEDDGLGSDGLGLFPDEVNRIQERAIADGERNERRADDRPRPVDPYTAQYDADTVVTYPGAVVGLSRIPLSHDRTGLLVKLHVGGETPRVYLGPENWLADHGLRPGIGDRLSVTGSRYRTNDGIVLIARELTWGNHELVLRDAAGTPRWRVPRDD